MPLDPAAQELLVVLDGLFPDVETMTAAEARAQVEAITALPMEVEPVAEVTDRTIPGPDADVPVRIYRPEGDDRTRPLVVWFHGGGWVLFGLDSHDGTCRAVANAVGAVVVSVDYRVAPEHRYPAALDDAVAATRWALAHATELGADPSRVAVAGDSAGGNLAASVAQVFRDDGDPSLAFQLLLYPVTDGVGHYPSEVECAEGGFLRTVAMDWYWDQYVPDRDRRGEPGASPLRADDLSGLPPALVVTAEVDPLRDEGEAYALALGAAGVPVEAIRAPGLFHGFFSMVAFLPPAQPVVDRAHAALREALAPVSGAAREATPDPTA